MSMPLSELASRLGATIHGHGPDANADPVIHGVASLEAAGPGEVSFLANVRYRRHLPETRAAAVERGAGARVVSSLVR